MEKSKRNVTKINGEKRKYIITKKVKYKSEVLKLKIKVYNKISN